MKGLVHSGLTASIPSAQVDKPAAHWEDVANGVLEEIQPVVEGLARKAADQFYDEVLYRIQDYLADNAKFNLVSRLDAANRQATYDRQRHYEVKQERDALLSALTAAEAHFGPFAEITVNGNLDPEDVRVMALIRAAIAKATGAAS